MGKLDTPNHGNISSFKLGRLTNPGEDFGGGFNTKSGTRSGDTPKNETNKFQGTEKGATAHTYKGE